MLDDLHEVSKVLKHRKCINNDYLDLLPGTLVPSTSYLMLPSVARNQDHLFCMSFYISYSKDFGKNSRFAVEVLAEYGTLMRWKE